MTQSIDPEKIEPTPAPQGDPMPEGQDYTFPTQHDVPEQIPPDADDAGMFGMRPTGNTMHNLANRRRVIE